MEELIESLKTIAILLGMVFGIVALFRSKKSDDSGDGQKMGMIMSDLGYVKSNTDEIKAEQQRQRDTNTKFAVELAEVAASAKQAHKRLDEHINGKSKSTEREGA
jgi:hypothetical protein